MTGRVRTTGCQTTQSNLEQLRRERGQSLLETAIVVPILLLLLAAVVDAGRAFDAYIVLTNAVREGARYGTAVEPLPSVADITDVVVQDVVGSGTNVTQMDSSELDVTVIMGTTAITVTADYDFPLWFGGIVGIPTFHLHKLAAMPMWAEE